MGRRYVCENTLTCSRRSKDRLGATLASDAFCFVCAVVNVLASAGVTCVVRRNTEGVCCWLWSPQTILSSAKVWKSPPRLVHVISRIHPKIVWLCFLVTSVCPVNWAGGVRFSWRFHPSCVRPRTPTLDPPQTCVLMFFLSSAGAELGFGEFPQPGDSEGSSRHSTGDACSGRRARRRETRVRARWMLCGSRKRKGSTQRYWTLFGTRDIDAFSSAVLLQVFVPLSEPQTQLLSRSSSSWTIWPNQIQQCLKGLECKCNEHTISPFFLVEQLISDHISAYQPFPQEDELLLSLQTWIQA